MGTDTSGAKGSATGISPHPHIWLGPSSLAAIALVGSRSLL